MFNKIQKPKSNQIKSSDILAIARAENELEKLENQTCSQHVYAYLNRKLCRQFLSSLYNLMLKLRIKHLQDGHCHNNRTR
jgi:hypothetical protein